MTENETLPKTALEIQAALREPFHPDDVEFRAITTSKDGKQALAAAYVSANVVKDRLDEVVGVSGWRLAYSQIGPKSFECRLSLKIDGEWVEKADVGNTSDQPDEGDRVKAAYSDALKRAAVMWGVGRYLGYLGHQWCPYDHQKKQIVTPPRLPDWAIPAVLRGKAVQSPQKPAQQSTPRPGPAQEPPCNDGELQRWVAWLNQDPSLQDINACLTTTFAALDKSFNKLTKRAVWNAITAHCNSAGLAFDNTALVFAVAR